MLCRYLLNKYCCSSAEFAEKSDWFVKPHQLQSQGEIPLSDGTATAICAAYEQTEVLAPLEYYVCALPDTADANFSACVFKDLTCCSCIEDSCPLGINVTRGEFVDHVGIVADGCRVQSSVEGSFVCIVEKNVSAYSAKQYIGTFNFVPEVHPSYALAPWQLGLASGSGGAALVLLPLLCIGIVALCVLRICCRKHKVICCRIHNRNAGQVPRREHAEEYNDEGEGGETCYNICTHCSSNCFVRLWYSYGTVETCLVLFTLHLRSICISVTYFDLLLLLSTSISECMPITVFLHRRRKASSCAAIDSLWH